MKKSIILLCAFFATLHVYAQDVPAILFFQNDSIIQSFLRSEVDSLGYSYVDINGETQNEVATQLVYLKDTIIQIPLAEIDSVVYTPPSYSIWVMTRNPKDIGHYKATLCGTLGGKFVPDAVINETGFLISYYSKEGKTNKKVSVGNSVGDFEKEIDFKKPEYGCKNIFYYRAYAIVNGVGYVGTERIISLSPIELTAYSAKVSKEPTTEDECSVTVYGDISLSHRKEIEEAGFPMGFFVGKEDNPKADDDGVMRFDGELNENGLIESKLDGLEPGTKYYYRPFIETCKIEYGGTGSFVTPPQVVVTTRDYSDIDIKATTAKLSLSVDVKMDERQLDSFPVGIQIIGPRYSPDDEEHQQFDFWVRDTPHQEFSGIIKNLIPNSLYTYRAYAEINGKLYYGEGIDFWTKDLEVKTYDAEVSRDEVESATVIAISISGEVFEAEAVKRGEQCGFYYDTHADVDINSSKIEFNFVGDYQSSSPYSWHKNWVEYKDVAFYYRAFITYKGKTYFGEVKRCTTKKEDVVVKTYDATDITSTTAHISGEVMNKDINIEGEQFGFYYDTKADMDADSPCAYGKFTSSSNGSFYMNKSKLTPETTYYYRAFVTYKGKTYFGEVKQFTTLSIEVKTYDATNVSSTTAHISGEVMNKDVNFEGEQFGFYYDTQANVNADSPCAYGKFTSSSNLSFNLDMTDLKKETTYYYRAFVTYKGQTYYGEIKQFTTVEIVVKTYDATNITSTTAHVSGEIMNKEINFVGARYGFLYYKETDIYSYPKSVDAIFKKESDWTFNWELQYLKPETTYCYQAYVIYNGEVYYGELKQFTTGIKDDIAVYTYNATNVTSRTARVEGGITDGSVKWEGEKYGFYYDTQENVTPKSPCVYDTFTSGSSMRFKMDLMDLVPETTYYYRAFVTYKGQTFYGEIKQFTTRIEGNIVVKTNDAEIVTSTTALLSGEILSTNVDLDGERCGFVYKKKGGEDDWLSKKSILEGDIFYECIKDLLPNTTYLYQAVVIYNEQAYTGEIIEFTTKSAELEEGYAEYDANTETLTFRYGIKPNARNVYDIVSCGWTKKYKKVIFEPSFIHAKPIDISNWFSEAHDLKEIVGLEYLNTSMVTDMSHMFYQCWSLTSLDLSSFNTSHVRRMVSMFEECYNLTSIDMSSFDTSNVTVMSNMFYRCKSITVIDVSSFNTSKVRQMSFMFGWCEKLKTIYAGSGWSTESILSGLLEQDNGPGFGSDVFYGCTELVGGAGTKYYVSSRNDYKLAHIDGGEGNPGVLTAK